MNTAPLGEQPAARRRWGLWAAFAAAAALLVLLAVGMTLNPRELPSALIGKPWPAMVLPQLGSAAADGAPIGAAQLRGKPRVLNVWASWCAPCREEHPALLELARQLKAQGRADQLIGVNYKDPNADATRWLGRLGNPYATTLVDANGRLGIELGVYGVPETFLIDARGIIVWKHVGVLTPELIAREVMPRLEGRS
jgi:cytochrome c biogenesis protein CcmG, thiol:disulfide interchange protein DsbE